MATVSPTIVPVGEHAYMIKWLDIPKDSTGIPIAEKFADFADRSVQIGGDFDSSTVTLEGSNDGTTYFTLNDLQGSTISKTSAALEGVAEAPLYVRPKVVGGTTVAVDVFLFIRRGRGGLEI